MENNEKFNPVYDSRPTIRFSLRLTEKLEHQLGYYSQKYDISMNSIILKCMEYAFKNAKDLI